MVDNPLYDKLLELARDAITKYQAETAPGGVGTMSELIEKIQAAKPMEEHFVEAVWPEIEKMESRIKELESMVRRQQRGR